MSRTGGDTFRSLRIRNYRLYFIGMLISVFGTWMQGTAQSWLVLKELKGSGAELGLLSACTFLPVTCFGLFGGLVAERLDNRKVLIATSSVSAVLAAVMAALRLSHNIELWMVFVLALFQGCTQSIDMPSRHTFSMRMVGKDDLPNAIGLTSAMFNGARIFGPTTAGLMIPLVGTGGCFLLNAISFVAVIGALAMMRPAEFHNWERAGAAKGQLRAAFRYLFATPILRLTWLSVLFVGTFSINYQVLLPLLAKERFGGSATLVGLFSSCLGVGAVVGALLSARRRSPRVVLVFLGALAVGASMLLVAAAPNRALAMSATVLVGFSFMTFMNNANSLLQLNSDPTFRGRVMGMYSYAFAGTVPLGATTIGLISEWHGPRAAWGFGGLVGVATAVWGVAAAQRWGLHVSRSPNRMARAMAE